MGAKAPRSPLAYTLLNHPNGEGSYENRSDSIQPQLVKRLARVMHETPSGDRGDGRATGQPQGLGPEAYSLVRRKDGRLRGRSRWFV